MLERDRYIGGKIKREGEIEREKDSSIPIYTSAGTLRRVPNTAKSEAHVKGYTARDGECGKRVMR